MHWDKATDKPCQEPVVCRSVLLASRRWCDGPGTHMLSRKHGEAGMDVFAKSEPVAREVYAAIIAAVSKFGPVEAEEKKTSIHLVAGSGFAGVHPRKAAVLLNIRSATEIKHPRIRKVEQVSKSRFHNEMIVASPEEVDSEVVGWLREAYQLSSGK